MNRAKKPSKSYKSERQKQNKESHQNISQKAKEVRMSFLPPIDSFPKDFTLENVEDMILSGFTFMEIWQYLGVSASRFYDWMYKEENSARISLARRAKADTYADMSELVLKFSKGSMNELLRAKEQSNVFRWRARQSNPDIYGDKVTLANDKDQPFQIIGMKVE